MGNSYNVKPQLWNIDPWIFAHNCRRQGFPVPVLAMPFWEGAGNKAYDVSGKSNFGTLFNGPKWVGSPFGSALSFDGSNDYVNILDSNNLDVTNITISMWIKANSLANYGGIIDKNRDGGFGWYTEGSNSIQTRLSTGAGTYSTPFTGLTSNTWYHLVQTYDGETICMYNNGKLVATNTFPSGNISQNDFDITIGCLQSATKVKEWFFNGLVDNAMLFNCALTAAQVQTLYDNPFFMFQPIPVPYGYAAPVGGLSIPVAIHHYQHNIRV